MHLYPQSPAPRTDGMPGVLRIVVQGLLLLPALSGAGVLPMLFVAAAETLADGKWRGAAFGVLALPGIVALVASVLMPRDWQAGKTVRRVLVTGLLMAGASAFLLGHMMVVTPEGSFRWPYAPTPFLLVLGPLTVTIWNLLRLTGRRFAMLAGLCLLLAVAAVLWTVVAPGCKRDYDAATGEHSACL